MDINKKIVDIIRDKNTQLPTLPLIIENIFKIASDDKTSSKDLAAFISKDQAMVNKILKIANSAYFGLSKTVSSLSHAITIIGFKEVTNLTIGLNVFSIFQKIGAEGILNMKDLWLHSIGCALISKKIAKEIVQNDAEQAFLIGLLHDMGKVILAVYFPTEYKTVLREANESQTPLYLKENERFGLDHAMIAGMLMEQWNFPDSIAIPCRFHHNSSVCDPKYQIQAIEIEIADNLCHRAEIGRSGNSVIGNIEQIQGKLGLTSEKLDYLLSNLTEERKSAEEFVTSIS